MVEWHTKSDKMKSGGKRNTIRRCTKKKAWMGGSAANTNTHAESKETRETQKGLGKTVKVRLTSTKYANVSDGKKIVKAEIVAVKENNSNRLFARSNTTTKGAIISVKIGSEEKLARVTSRPGQAGIVNAKLV